MRVNLVYLKVANPPVRLRHIHFSMTVLVEDIGLLRDEFYIRFQNFKLREVKFAVFIALLQRIPLLLNFKTKD